MGRIFTAFLFYLTANHVKSQLPLVCLYECIRTFSWAPNIFPSDLPISIFKFHTWQYFQTLFQCFSASRVLANEMEFVK